MKIKSIALTRFKRFTNLQIVDIPKTAKLVILVGPNGSGKTSLFEAFNFYYKWKGYGNPGDKEYLIKGVAGDENGFEIAQTVNINFHDGVSFNHFPSQEIKSCFYFRSAYRNEADFEISSMSKQGDPRENIRLSSLMQNDQTVSKNYQRLVSNTVSDLFDESRSSLSVRELRERLIGKIRSAVENIFDDLKLSTLGKPLYGGTFYFSKGEVSNFKYKNLSAGEKSAFDLVLDLVVQSEYFSDSVYCIDEPEVHMHTKLQGKVLHELYRLVPEHSQLWISTHSIGMIRAAQEIEKKNPGTVYFIDFGDRDYDMPQIIRPSKAERELLNRFYELAFGDFAKLMLPETLVVCEGDANGKKRKDFDKRIYQAIFETNHPEVFFVSGGSCNEIEHLDSVNGGILQVLMKNTRLIKLIDRDDRSNREVIDLQENGFKVLKRRNLESYLLDDSVICKLCDKLEQPEKKEECLEVIRRTLKQKTNEGKAPDDYKQARGLIYTELKNILNLSQCGNNADSFIRDTLAPLISPDMDVYRELESEIFG